ncbi:MAG: hypothetical protein MUP16_10030 [Sedimentisphaerales bacterium]|nr:hypothetical protein [Sedimentisphaerales bacterium]
MRKIAVFILLVLGMAGICQAATIKAAQAGNWSDTNTWIGAAVPTDGCSADCNGRIIVMDVNTIPTTGTLLSLISPATAGQLTVDLNSVDNRIINATTITAGTNTTGLINVSGSTYTLVINGNVTGGSSASASGIYNTATGASTITITGNITGGTTLTTYGFNNISAGTVNITGNIVGGSSTARGIYNNSTGAITITGNVTGGSTLTANGIYNISTGIITITGNLIFDVAAPYTGYLPTWTVGSQYYVQFAGIKCPQQLSATQVLAGILHGDITGTLPYLRNPIVIGN